MWYYDKFGEVLQPVVGPDGTLYLSTSNNYLYAIASTGKSQCLAH